MIRKKYIENIKTFREHFFRENLDLLTQLQEGQSPDTMMITCSDSRIVPHLKTGAFPGDIFLFRNMGNFIPPYREKGDDPTGVAAFLEYGATWLGAKHIVVMGHTNCGAIKGIFTKSEKVENSLFVKHWLRNGEEVKRIVLDDFDGEDEDTLAERGCIANVKLQVENIKTYPFVRDLREKNQIAVHGWIYNVRTVEMHYLSEENGGFVLLE